MQNPTRAEAHPALESLKAFAASPDYSFERGVPLYEALLHSSFLEDLLVDALLTVRDFPAQQLSNARTEGWVRGWKVADYGKLAIAVIHRLTAPPETLTYPMIVTKPNDHWFGIHTLKAEATYMAYTAENFVPNIPLTADARLTRVANGPLKQFQSMLLRAGQDAIDITEFRGEMLYLEIESRSMLSTTPVFRNSDLGFDHMVAGSPHSSRIELLTKFLSRFEYEPSLPVLAELSRKHPEHFVRWTAARHALCISEEKGTSIIEEMANDSHAHVRAAARQTLDILSQRRNIDAHH